ncbi:MAG: MerR family transcriptional regulator [Sphingomonadaceae bacterium]|nr:MerR family transcriptional regulator [Sphingomonadaceae bacterium]
MDVLDITEVVRRTGLSARALRFYEARGLVTPLRTASARRLFGPAELERVHRIVALKKAGLSLAAIGALFRERSIDLKRLLSAQLESLDAQAADIAQARAILSHTLSRIDRGEPIDAATFCSLIRDGDRIMQTENWKTVADRYFSPEEQARWAETMKDAPAGFDPAAYQQKWADLGTRIGAALPLDSASDKAQAFLAEWTALLAPFKSVATPEMMAGATRLYDNMGEWQGQADPGFGVEVWNFIKAAGAASR